MRNVTVGCARWLAPVMGMAATADAQGPGYAGRATSSDHPEICLPREQQMTMQIRAAANAGRLKPERGGPTDGPMLYPFYPQGGTLYRDLNTGNFVDLNPSAGAVRNYLCELYGNDGHAGCDSGSPTWEEMAIGMPVFAVLDGTVVDVHDGDPDMNTSCQPGGNHVILDHGGGRQTWYLHFRRNSVAVGQGQVVRAGQQLGLVGSSGCSFAPHLHFQSMQNGAVYEPCRCVPAWKQRLGAADRFAVRAGTS